MFRDKIGKDILEKINKSIKHDLNAVNGVLVGDNTGLSILMNVISDTMERKTTHYIQTNNLIPIYVDYCSDRSVSDVMFKFYEYMFDSCWYNKYFNGALRSYIHALNDNFTWLFADPIAVVNMENYITVVESFKAEAEQEPLTNF